MSYEKPSDEAGRSVLRYGAAALGVAGLVALFLYADGRLASPPPAEATTTPIQQDANG